MEILTILLQDVNTLGKLIDYGIAAGIAGVFIGYLIKRANKLEEKNEELAASYASLAEKSLTALTLVDDKLKNDAGNNEKITEIHRIVGEIYEVVKRIKEDQR